LRVACEAIVELVREAGVEFDAVGGLTLGADQFAHGVALVADRGWFVIRKQPKGRGTDQWVEGTVLGPGVRVLLVDDVVTTGGPSRCCSSTQILYASQPVTGGSTNSRMRNAHTRKLTDRPNATASTSSDPAKPITVTNVMAATPTAVRHGLSRGRSSTWCAA